jgi:hypothetical protein
LTHPILTLPKTAFYYLATPYTNYEGGLEKAYHDARMITAGFLKQGVTVFSPIVHTHPVARIGGIDPLDLNIWIPFDEPFMRAAGACIVAMLPGWKKSKGVRAEIDFFNAAGKPVLYYDPEEEIFE